MPQQPQSLCGHVAGAAGGETHTLPPGTETIPNYLIGNHLQQIINGDTTTYLCDDANRLKQLNGQTVYIFDNNGNLLSSDTMTNTWDAANRLTLRPQQTL